jgi:hypothetical protein
MLNGFNIYHMKIKKKSQAYDDCAGKSGVWVQVTACACMPSNLIMLIIVDAFQNIDFATLKRQMLVINGHMDLWGRTFGQLGPTVQNAGHTAEHSDVTPKPPLISLRTYHTPKGLY